MKSIRFSCCILAVISFIFALEPARVRLDPVPKLRGDEALPFSKVVPYIGGRQSPGDSIGMTWNEYQANGCYGQRLVVDSRHQVHVDWMWMDATQTSRYCAWNARYVDGIYFGETQASLSWSGMPNLDITRHVNPDSQRTVICYHYWPGGNYRSWIDIDSANLAGSWPNNPKDLPINDHIWPRIAVTQNNTILLATGDNNYERNHLYRSTDFGDSWDLIADFDSIHKMGHFLRASHFPGSQKAVFVYTQYFCDTSGCGCRDQDVWYMTTGDNGMTWSDRIDLTNYQPYPIDSARVYVGTNAVYDANDNLHIAWSGRKVTDYMYEASKIFHWDEVHDVFSVVNSPSIYYYEPDGWWIATATSGSPGAYHMPAMDPQLIVDTTSNWLYCLWQGNDDYNDCSAGRYFNGELYGSVSMDSGLTWSDYVNLTNTRSPGAGPGACMDEDYMTAYPYVVNDSIYITFIEDKDAGGYVQGEGILTENPVRCWVFHKDLIPGIKEKNPLKTEYTTPMLDVYPNPFRDKTQIRYMIQDTRYMMNGYSLKIFDAAGQLVRDFSRSTPNALHPTVITWDGSDNTGKKLPGGVYFLEFEAGDYKETKKLILLK